VEITNQLSTTNSDDKEYQRIHKNEEDLKKGKESESPPNTTTSDKAIEEFQRKSYL
jgi:hypothetical protein